MSRTEVLPQTDPDAVPIADTFAEAFPMTGTRLIITAAAPKWAWTAGNEFCGFATSVIACDVEAGIERIIPAEETPDGRPGVSVLAFAFGRKGLETAVAGRVGQCVLTCPTTACYNGVESGEPEGGRRKAESGRRKAREYESLSDLRPPTSDLRPQPSRIRVGGLLRYFGDGYQISKKLGTRRFWRMPVMEGEFLCEDYFNTVKGIGGGNLLICGRDQVSALRAAESAVQAMKSVRDVILPFPGGIVRSGSKVGSKYPKLKASTNDAYCPTLRANVETELPEGTGAVYEIVIDGFRFEAIQQAMRAGLHAAREKPGLTLITAGNYGGKLGPHHFFLRDVV
jgi:formylmethanofuran--tetrahydromethanopterin N-formyltransferase